MSPTMLSYLATDLEENEKAGAMANGLRVVVPRVTVSPRRMFKNAGTQA